MEPLKKISYESMGTSWSISFFEVPSGQTIEDTVAEIQRESEAFNQLYSRFVPNSLVLHIAESPAGTFEVPEDFMRMLSLYQALYSASAKRLNPLIGFTISDLGYDSTYSLTKKDVVRTTPDLFETVRVVDKNHIETTAPVLVDFGALGKGYFVDRIVEILREHGFTHFLVDGSGDLFYETPHHIPITIGLEDPHDTKKVIGTIALAGGALCGSAGNRRAWSGRHHILDPYTGDSPTEIVATWVAAPRAALADALATCLFFVTPESVPSLYEFEYLIMNKERRVRYSPKFPLTLFS